MLFFLRVLSLRVFTNRNDAQAPSLLQSASPSHHQLCASGCLTLWKRGRELVDRLYSQKLRFVYKPPVGPRNPHCHPMTLSKKIAQGRFQNQQNDVVGLIMKKIQGSLGVSNLSRIRWKLCLLRVVTFPNLVLSMFYLDQRWASRSWYQEVLSHVW